MSGGGANAELERGRPDPGRSGRSVGIALFWLLLCYVIGMSALSIIPSLFFPHLGPRAQAPQLAQCLHEIDLLDRELLDKSSASLHSRGLAGLHRWLHHWDERYMALTGGCGPLEGAREDLHELRAGLESLLRGYEGGAMKAHERIRRALEQMKQSTAPARSKD